MYVNLYAIYLSIYVYLFICIYTFVSLTYFDWPCLLLLLLLLLLLFAVFFAVFVCCALQVVEHGLFPSMASAVIVAGATGIRVAGEGEGGEKPWW